MCILHLWMWTSNISSASQACVASGYLTRQFSSGMTYLGPHPLAIHSQTSLPPVTFLKKTILIMSLPCLKDLWYLLPLQDKVWTPWHYLKDLSQSPSVFFLNCLSSLLPFQDVATMTETVLSPSKLFRPPCIFSSPLSDLLEKSLLHSFSECLLNVRQPAGIRPNSKKYKETSLMNSWSSPHPKLHLALGLALSPSWVVCSRVLPHPLRSCRTSTLGHFFNTCHVTNAQ